MLFQSILPLLLAVLLQIAAATPLTNVTPGGRTKFHILTELVNTTEFVTKARFHGKTVVPVMSGTAGKLFVQKDPGPMAFLNQTFSFDVNYLSFDVPVDDAAHPMTQPLVQPFEPSNISIFDPVTIKAYTVRSKRASSIHAELFHKPAQDGLVPLSTDFLGWVVCQLQDYSFQLFWLHNAAAVPGALNDAELPEKCARVYLKPDERDVSGAASS
ncbi:uncharacterized protein J3D65DRAFT_676818 [Phyllosticta citribraziliensis]|uniref:DUF7907 domain-containing protein n=1 Tax=Phyllosticta citribraziliensis TaxID=989973 RepID=A0ABR1LWF2_9PEZI